jgi:hypothetical protein
MFARKLVFVVLALFVTTAAVGCATEEDSTEEEIITLGPEDGVDVAPSDDTVNATAITKRCYSYGGFQSEANAKRYCRYGISGAGRLVNVYAAPRAIIKDPKCNCFRIQDWEVMCCFEKS